MPLDLSRVGFRGDTRAPEEIFNFGFRRRQDNWAPFEEKWREYLDVELDKWLQAQRGSVSPSLDSDSDSDDDNAGLGYEPADVEYPNLRHTDTTKSQTVTIVDTSKKSHAVQLDLPKSPEELYKQWLAEAKDMKVRASGDVVPASAVCITSLIDVAALFPLPDEKCLAAMRDTTWIHVVYYDHALMTWQKQEEAMENLPKILARSREMASLDIPSGHIFAAVKCTRTWTRKVKKSFPKIKKVDWRRGATFALERSLSMNPKLRNQGNLPKIRNRVMALIGNHLGKTYACADFSDLPDGAVTG